MKNQRKEMKKRDEKWKKRDEEMKKLLDRTMTLEAAMMTKDGELHRRDEELHRRDEELHRRDEEIKRQKEEVEKLKATRKVSSQPLSEAEEFLHIFEEERRAESNIGIGYHPSPPIQNSFSGMHSVGNSNYPVHQNQTRNNLKIDEQKPRMPFYNGKTSWKSFLVQLEMVSKKYDWRPSERHENMILCLRDDALEFVAEQPEEIRNDPNMLQEKMERRFGDNLFPETHRAKLQNLRRQPRESIDELQRFVLLFSRHIQVFRMEIFTTGCVLNILFRVWVIPALHMMSFLKGHLQLNRPLIWCSGTKFVKFKPGRQHP